MFRGMAYDAVGIRVVPRGAKLQFFAQICRMPAQAGCSSFGIHLGRAAHHPLEVDAEKGWIGEVEHL